ncbi:hypothetical protein [Streptomyces sp. CS081A]|uniref:hypothetical protein n=1 Tax=Streptomyces sp. CS081A TaxID=2162709 RepID=UPI000D51BC82|nr:hypothetical protein [Streptomyces sp. CS081A]PVC77683.1 hypothetical protein DBP18_01135 [Streptomyces sp. CS081A]
MTDPVAARQAAKAAEQERLKRARERRESKESSGVSGFAQRKWRWLGVGGGEAVGAVLTMLMEIAATTGGSETERAILAQAVAGDPDREALLPVVRSGLGLLPAESVLGHLRNLWAAGVRWLNEPGIERCRVLCSTAPGPDLLNTRRSHAVSGGPAFSLFATAATRGAIPVPNRFLDEVLAWAPLSVVDDLIDHGGLMVEDAPWEGRDEEEGLYLRARLAPFDITGEQAERLGWQTHLRRRSFLRGRTLVRQEPDDVWDLLYDVVVDCDVTALDALDAALPRPEQIELRDLKSGALLGQWPRALAEDRGLWPLMAALWRPTGLVDAGRSPFYALVALNRAYDLVRSGDPEAAAEQARSLTLAKNSRKVPPELVQEGHALAAYAAVAQSEELLSPAARDRLLDAAVESAEAAADQGGSVAERNLRLLRTWRATNRNERGPFSNPFLDIGLEHGDGGWEEHCRKTYRQSEGDTKAQSALNRAEGRIRDALRGEAGWDVFYRLPLDRSRYAMPSETPRHLVPPLEALPRRTPVTSGGELEVIRARAAVELLDDFRTTAPRLDRHHSAR